MSKIMYTEEDFIIHLKDLINEAGGAEKFCAQYKINRWYYLDQMLDGTVTPSIDLLKKLGYNRQSMIVKVEEK